MAAEAAGLASAFRTFSSVFAPSPGSARSRSCSAAARRSSKVSTPSSDQSLRAVFGPRPGTCITSTRPAGSFDRSLASACRSPVSESSTILASIVPPIPESRVAFPSRASCATGTADSRMRAEARR